MGIKKDARLDTMKSLVREIELIGDVVMTTGLEAQDADNVDQIVGAAMGLENHVTALQQIIDTIKTLQRVAR